MAFLQFLRYSLILLHISFPISHSLTCTFQNLTNSHHLYKNCIDLPTLDSYLHRTYHSSISLLSITFLSSATPNHWISWAINPFAAGMMGAQSLIAFTRSDGSMFVDTYNIKVVNQVWQVGGSVIDGETPGKHELEDGNLNSKGKLHLLDHVKINDSSGDANGSIANHAVIVELEDQGSRVAN